MAESNLPLISIISADGVTFNVSPIIVKQMKTVESFLEDESPVSITSSVIPLSIVKAFELSKTIEYLNYHHVIRESGENDEETKEFDQKFVNELNPEEMKAVLVAANYLNVNDLLEFMFQAFVDHIKNKSVKYVRNFFGIVPTFTPEEEEEIRQQHLWAHEGIDED